jgi:hypothetical protein
MDISQLHVHAKSGGETALRTHFRADFVRVCRTLSDHLFGEVAENGTMGATGPD